MNSKELKEGHEVAIGNQLLRALKLDGKLLRHGKDDGEPDLIYSLEGRIVGIEISTAYYGQGPATVDWKIARGKTNPSPRRWVKLGVPNNPDEAIKESVQRELNDKCAKHYSGVDAVWLCIEQHAGLSRVADTEELIASITVPVNQFERIYLGFHAPLLPDGGGFRPYKLPCKADLKDETWSCCSPAPPFLAFETARFRLHYSIKGSGRDVTVLVVSLQRQKFARNTWIRLGNMFATATFQTRSQRVAWCARIDLKQRDLDVLSWAAQVATDI